jgi:hypothetical protein
MFTLTYTGSRLPRALGLAGVVPFIALGLASHVEWTHQDAVQFALISYGALILAFVGALQWGLAMRQSGPLAARAYFWSVIPALIAWVALNFPPIGGVLILIVGLWTDYLQDRMTAPALQAPHWYTPLRLRLTVGATLGLAVAVPAIWGA